MRKILILCWLLIAAVFVVAAYEHFFVTQAYAAVTISATNGSASVSYAGHNNLSRETISWTSDASGNVDATITGIAGKLWRVSFNPADGASSPTANYDITLTDVDGIDLLNGQGANLSQSASADFPCCLVQDAVTTTSIPVVTLGSLTLTIDAAGNAKSGAIRLFYEPIN